MYPVRIIVLLLLGLKEEVGVSFLLWHDSRVQVILCVCVYLHLCISLLHTFVYLGGVFEGGDAPPPPLSAAMVRLSCKGYVYVCLRRTVMFLLQYAVYARMHLGGGVLEEGGGGGGRSLPL